MKTVKKKKMIKVNSMKFEKLSDTIEKYKKNHYGSVYYKHLLERHAELVYGSSK